MITITRPLNYDVVETMKLTSVEMSKDGTKLILLGTDENSIPIRAITYIGNEVAQDIVYGAIFGQLKDYRSFKDNAEAFKALQAHAGDSIQIKIVRETYEDPLTGITKTGTRTLLNPADF